MVLIWECGGLAHCIMEHHLGDLYLFTDADKGHEAVDSHYLLRSPLKVDSTARTWEVGCVRWDLVSLLHFMIQKLHHFHEHCFSSLHLDKSYFHTFS